MTPLCQHSPSQPFHISVGAVVVNEEGKVYVHKRTKENIPAKYIDGLGGLNEVFVLMRESLENDESLEAAVHRGLMEEFGATGEIVRYLGSIQALIQPHEYAIEKTTLYFQVRMTDLGQRPVDDEEGYSELEWHAPEFLIERMEAQAKGTTRLDLDESKILKTYLTYA